MDILKDIVIIGGMTSVALLWVFCACGALTTLWDTFGQHALKLALKLVKRIRR